MSIIISTNVLDFFSFFILFYVIRYAVSLPYVIVASQ